MSPLPAAGGVIPLDKPAGPTSHDMVAVARRSLGVRRVGHTGTLDPFATGLLLLCVGPATRLVEFLTGLPKSYTARVRLGVRTTTDDLDGEVVSTSEAWRALARGDVERALEPLRGAIAQTPPVFSAKKIEGEAAHYRARRGEVLEMAPVDVEVLDLRIAGWDPPDVDLHVRVSSGTYVRALARDLGEALGSGAHLTALRRTSIGAWGLDGALAPEGLADPDAVARAWMTPAAALAHLPSVTVDDADAARLAHGQSVATPEGGDADAVAVLRADELIAVAARAGDRLRPRKVFAEAAP